LSQAEAEECERRITNYHQIKEQLDQLLKKGLEQAPWKNRQAH